jgi:hypothetical protein
MPRLRQTIRRRETLILNARIAEPCAAANCSGRHSLCSHPQTRPRRLSAQAAPPSAVAELGVVRRFRTRSLFR